MEMKENIRAAHAVLAARCATSYAPAQVRCSISKAGDRISVVALDGNSIHCVESCVDVARAFGLLIYATVLPCPELEGALRLSIELFDVSLL